MTAMNTNLADALRVAVNGQLSPALISAANQDWIDASVRALPAAITSFFGYEVRAQDPQARADFLLCVNRPLGAGILAAAARWLPAEYVAAPAWQHLAGFASSWVRPGSPLRAHVENMWLEFDIAGPVAGVPTPFAFFKPTGHAVAAGRDLAWVVDGLARLTGAPVPSAVVARLRQVVDALPPAARVFQIAATMMSRQTAAVRLCICELAPPQVGPYLDAIGWPGDGGRVLADLAWLRHFIDGLAINIDVADTVLPKLGFECYIDFDSRVLPRTKAFLDELVDRQLCLPHKRDEILRYHGWIDERANIQNWPVHLITESMLMRPDEVSVFWRKLHHVKLVLQPGGELEAKIYLLVCHSWLRPALLARARAYLGGELA